MNSLKKWCPSMIYKLLSYHFSFVAVFLVLFVAVFMSFSVTALSASVSVYAGVSDSDQIVKNLIGIYQNDNSYDPFNEYVVLRSGQYEYYVFFGKDLSDDYRYYRYYGTQNGYNTVWQIDTGTGNNLRIDSHGYLYVGNTQGAINSEKETSNKYLYVIMSVAILIAIVVIFKTFRQRYTPTKKGWSV